MSLFWQRVKSIADEVGDNLKQLAPLNFSNQVCWKMLDQVNALGGYRTLMDSEGGFCKIYQVDRFVSFGQSGEAQRLGSDAAESLNLLLGLTAVLLDLSRIVGDLPDEVVEIGQGFERVSDLVHDLKGEVPCGHSLIGGRMSRPCHFDLIFK